MRSQISQAICLLAVLGGLAQAADDKDKPTTTHTACTASATSGAFYDLRPDIAAIPKEGVKAIHGAPKTDYHARGYDYGSNFTLNICSPVVEKVDNVIEVDKALWANISAYYVSKGDVYSLGQSNGVLTPRGRKLVLQYTGGSPCGPSEKRGLGGRDVERRAAVHSEAKWKDYDDADEKRPKSSQKIEDVKVQEKDTKRRKSATISFLCDRDPTASHAAASFVGTDPDQCAYFFEIRSQHACAGAEPHKAGSVGPGSVFAIIFLIAFLVYLLGGVFYQRTVSHARGWKQLPNYSLWAGIWGFIKDIFIIATSSCARFFPSRRGYTYISGSPNARGRNSREDENRLIDNLDEEWDD